LIFLSRHHLVFNLDFSRNQSARERWTSTLSCTFCYLMPLRKRHATFSSSAARMDWTPLACSVLPAHEQIDSILSETTKLSSPRPPVHGISRSRLPHCRQLKFRENPFQGLISELAALPMRGPGSFRLVDTLFDGLSSVPPKGGSYQSSFTAGCAVAPADDCLTLFQDLETFS